MADFNNLHNKEFEKASKSVENAKTNLSKWSDEVENCQNEHSNSTRAPTSVSPSTLPSTQTTAAIRNLTILQTPTTVRISPAIGIVPTVKTIRTG